jgi:hypothetical protein
MFYPASPKFFRLAPSLNRCIICAFIFIILALAARTVVAQDTRMRRQISSNAVVVQAF